MQKAGVFSLFYFLFISGPQAQLHWNNVDSLFQPLPPSIQVFRTTDPLDGLPNIAYYLIADLNDRQLEFTVDTTDRRRMTPSGFYARNKQPFVLLNTTFFSFATNQSLNLVMRNGDLLAYNTHTIPGRGRDTLTYRHVLGSAFGLSKKREPDIAWVYTDVETNRCYALQYYATVIKDSTASISYRQAKKMFPVQIPPSLTEPLSAKFKKWQMYTAIGGGPVLVQQGEIRITNNQELKFTGKAIDDRHPRTAIGYTKNGKLIILVVEGRHKGIAEGATLGQEARIFRDLGCWEAMNLDGGGSSCMLINGKETIRVSDSAGQRPVPAVFIIRQK